MKEALHVRGVLLLLMTSPGSPSIGAFEYNNRSDRLGETPLSSSNSKHMGVRYHVRSELVGKGDLSVNSLQTEDQHADIRTKAIGQESFEKHRNFTLRT